MRLDKVERRLYKLRSRGSRKDSSEVLYGDNFQIVEEQYYHIYFDYLTNLILNLITYENAPDTLDERFLEFNLRYYGYARIGGVDKDNIFVVGQSKTGEYGLNALGALIDTTSIENPFSVDSEHEKLQYITRSNYKGLSSGYITISNKYNYYLAGLATIYTDFEMIDRVAKTMAKIKATETRNIDMMRQQYIGLSREKNLTANQIFQQMNEGAAFINIDSDLGDLSNVLQVSDFDIHDYLPSLKTAWNNELDELLTMLGINTVGVDKKERLVVNEAAANAQLTEASANVYLQARNQQLELLNAVCGSDIHATFNQHAFDQLVKLQQAQNEQKIDIDDNNDGQIDNVHSEEE